MLSTQVLAAVPSLRWEVSGLSSERIQEKKLKTISDEYRKNDTARKP
jgi:hypothetical protein